MAMTLALVANSGLNTMIHSFREATDDWLSQRLAADLYLRIEQDVATIEDWLTIERPGLKVAKRYRTVILGKSPSGQPVETEVVSLQDAERFQAGVTLIHSIQNAVTKFEKSEGIYISERAWRLDGWQPGESLKLCDNRVKLPVLGVYRDYGNPKSQWMTNRQLFRDCWPDQLAMGISVYGPKSSDWGEIRSALAEKFGIQDDKIIDQNELRQIGLAVFDRTFAVTHALNALTLLVAAIGLFCAVSAIHHHRIAQQALLSSLGLTRMERGSLLLLQWGMLGLLCMVLVWPFGTALAAYLAAVVTPAAFGWSFPLQLEGQHYLVLALLAAACLVMAVVLPSLRLLYTSPAAMLREQNT
jgi:putative ABC transport system permease protein